MARILIIDDSTFQRKIISSILTADRHEVISATNGRDGLDAAQREHPDAIVTDLLMPDMDGFSFLQAVKTAGIGIPVLILTSDIQTATRDRCIALGAAGVMNKPVKKENLLEKVRQVLGAGKS
ncbi:MAG: response regulator [Methanoregula sp.]|jgi:twitching motility two-component system response regulator PilH